MQPVPTIRVSARYFCKAGNTLMEFSVIGSLVVIASLGMLLLLGDHLNQWFGGLKGNMQMQVGSTAAAETTQRNNAVTFKATEANRQQALAALHANLSADDSAVTPQTVGANGNTEESASQLEVLARKGLDAGNLTQKQYDLLMRMANQGHDMARLEAMLMDARQRAQGDSVVYNTVRYNYQGRTLSAPDLANLMGTQVVSFGGLRYDAERMGLFTDQRIGTLVDSASGRILGNSGAAHDIGSDATKAVNVGAAEAPGSTGSKDTHQQSGVICTSGEHQDDGAQCHP